jgi:hypothetical protein
MGPLWGWHHVMLLLEDPSHRLFFIAFLRASFLHPFALRFQHFGSKFRKRLALPDAAIVTLLFIQQSFASTLVWQMADPRPVSHRCHGYRCLSELATIGIPPDSDFVLLPCLLGLPVELLFRVFSVLGGDGKTRSSVAWHPLILSRACSLQPGLPEVCNGYFARLFVMAALLSS